MALEYLHDQPSLSVTSYREACSVPCIGDLVDVFPCTGKRTNIVIVDVSGRGSEARGHAHYLRHVVHTLADKRPPQSLLQYVDIAFHQRVAEFGNDRFASLFFATLHGRGLTYASAGHDLALLLSANGQHRHLPPTGPILGINASEFYRERTIDVAPGDRLVVVTDGITDARDAQGAFFGTSGVVRNALSAIEAGVDDPAAAILDAASIHGQGRFVEDASVLCVGFS